MQRVHKSGLIRMPGVISTLTQKLSERIEFLLIESHKDYIVVITDLCTSCRPARARGTYPFYAG